MKKKKCWGNLIGRLENNKEKQGDILTFSWQIKVHRTEKLDRRVESGNSNRNGAIQDITQSEKCLNHAIISEFSGCF